MTNPPAIQFGITYHIFNRGNNRDNLFIEERNYAYFLQLYTRYIPPVAITYAYCLLRNHFHLLVRIKSPEEQEASWKKPTRSPMQVPFTIKNPSQQFGNLFNAYTKAINKRFQRTGSLFENPFERIEITTQSHLLHLVAYIHCNPQKHGLIDDFRSWPYSSYHQLNSQDPELAETSEVLSWFGGVDAFHEYHDNPDLETTRPQGSSESSS